MDISFPDALTLATGNRQSVSHFVSSIGYPINLSMAYKILLRLTQGTQYLIQGG